MCDRRCAINRLHVEPVVVYTWQCKIKSVMSAVA